MRGLGMAVAIKAPVVPWAIESIWCNYITMIYNCYMQDVLLTVEGVSLYTLSAFVFLAFLWAGFVFYKKATEYHESEDVVFNAILLMGILSFVFSRLAFVVTKLDWFVGHWIRILFIREYPGMSAWGVFLGVLVGVFMIVNKTKKDLFNWLDLTALGLSAGVPIVYAAKGVFSTEPVIGSFISIGIIKGLLLTLWFFLLWWAEGEYRTFEWYRFRKTQARTGFVTGVFVFGFGLVNLIVGILTKDTAWWQMYSLLVVAGGLVVYIRSERRIKKDLELLQKNLKKIKWPKIKKKRK